MIYNSKISSISILIEPLFLPYGSLKYNIQNHYVSLVYNPNREKLKYAKQFLGEKIYLKYAGYANDGTIEVIRVEITEIGNSFKEVISSIDSKYFYIVISVSNLELLKMVKANKQIDYSGLKFDSSPKFGIAKSGMTYSGRVCLVSETGKPIFLENQTKMAVKDMQEKDSAEISAIGIAIMHTELIERKLQFKIRHPYVTLAFDPTREQIENTLNSVGSYIPMRYTGYGNNGKTECISVEIVDQKIGKQSTRDTIKKLGTEDLNFILAVDDEEQAKKILEGLAPCSSPIKCDSKIPYKKFNKTEQELLNGVFYGKLCFYLSKIKRNHIYPPEQFFPPVRTYK